MGPDSPFALLSPVLGYMALLLNHQSVLCMFFVTFLSQISSTITIWWKFSALRASFPSPNLVVQFYVLLASILGTVRHNLDRRTSGMAQASFGNSFLAKPSIIFTVRVFFYIEKLLHIWFLWPCFVSEIALFRKIFWPFCPFLESSNVRPHPGFSLNRRHTYFIWLMSEN